MSRLGDIYTAMAAVFNGVASVGTAYAKPPEVTPPNAVLPAVIPDLPDGEITWGASHDSRVHTITWTVLVARGSVLATAFDAVLPVMEDCWAAFQTNQRLGLSYVYSCAPTSYSTGAFQFMDDAFLGGTITFAVKEKTAVTFS